MADALNGNEGLWFGIGTVTTLLPSGLGYLKLEGDTRKRPFVVGRVLTGFFGEAFEEYGLEVGRQVIVALTDQGVVRLVPSHGRAPRDAVRELLTLIEKFIPSLKKHPDSLWRGSTITLTSGLGWHLEMLMKRCRNRLERDLAFDIPQTLLESALTVLEMTSSRNKYRVRPVFSTKNNLLRELDPTLRLRLRLPSPKETKGQ